VTDPKRLPDDVLSDAPPAASYQPSVDPEALASALPGLCHASPDGSLFLDHDWFLVTLLLGHAADEDKVMGWSTITSLSPETKSQSGYSPEDLQAIGTMIGQDVVSKNDGFRLVSANAKLMSDFVVIPRIPASEIIPMRRPDPAPQPSPHVNSGLPAPAPGEDPLITIARRDGLLH